LKKRKKTFNNNPNIEGYISWIVSSVYQPDNSDLRWETIIYCKFKSNLLKLKCFTWRFWLVFGAGYSDSEYIVLTQI